MFSWIQWQFIFSVEISDGQLPHDKLDYWQDWLAIKILVMNGEIFSFSFVPMSNFHFQIVTRFMINSNCLHVARTKYLHFLW